MAADVSSGLISLKKKIKNKQNKIKNIKKKKKKRKGGKMRVRERRPPREGGLQAEAGKPVEVSSLGRHGGGAS